MPHNVTVEVKYKSNDDGKQISDDNEISRVFVITETPETVILNLETETKYPHGFAYSGNELMFTTKKGNTAFVKVNNVPFVEVNNIPFVTIVIANASRYGIHLIFFKETEVQRQVYNSER
jgi:hypothetical protein